MHYPHKVMYKFSKKCFRWNVFKVHVYQIVVWTPITKIS